MEVKSAEYKGFSAAKTKIGSFSRPACISCFKIYISTERRVSAQRGYFMRYFLILLALLFIVTGAALLSKAPEKEHVEKQMPAKKLTAEEERIIADKGTEAPFTGKYYKNFEDGTYHCRRCGASLFPSTAKFESGSGWPSFDDAFPGAITKTPDADGKRVEITCAKCGAHLGHIFHDEGFTDKQVRYCVNSASLDFSTENRETAYFAGGCFWGVEHYFKKAEGVIEVDSGYMGGTVASPTYQQVCSGKTGHAETVRVGFDPSQTSYEKLAMLFFEIHDPTQMNRQGPDVGEQYRSEVFYASQEQRQVAEKLIGELTKKGLNVATKIAPAKEFWAAEDYHQDYYERTGKEPYCHVRVKRF
jgi:peptide methionine sulfoxide reductase msrA/msrB